MDWLVAFFKSVVLVYFMAMAWLIALSLMKIANFIDRIGDMEQELTIIHEGEIKEGCEESSHTTEDV